MWTYNYSTPSDELYHYGVKGMKWGVRKSEDEIRRERAKKYEDKARQNRRDIQTLTRQKSSTKSKIKQYRTGRKIKKLEKEQQRNERDAQAKREGKLTRKQKAITVGATVVAAYATYRMVQSGQMRRLVTKGKAALSGKKPSFKMNDALSAKNMSADDILANVVGRINPNYGEIGTKQNCRRCTFAYEMSRRGYDVVATKTTNSAGQNGAGLYNAVNKGRNIGTIEALTRFGLYDSGKSTSKVSEKTYELFKEGVVSGGKNAFDFENQVSGFGKAQRVLTALKTNPDRARGELAVKWKQGGGHSIAWEIVDGQPTMFDCQNGKSYSTVYEIADLFDHVESAGYTRLDNLDLDEDFLLKWVRNA